MARVAPPESAIAVEESSPRSTVLIGGAAGNIKSGIVSGGARRPPSGKGAAPAGMTTTALPGVSGMNKRNSSMASDVESTPKVPTPSKEQQGVAAANSNSSNNLKQQDLKAGKEDKTPGPQQQTGGGRTATPSSGSNKPSEEEYSPPTPSPQEYPSYLQAAYPTLTPQQQHQQQQQQHGNTGGYYQGYVAQTPEPASPAPPTAVYDVNSFFAQGGGTAFHHSAFTLSPAGRNNNNAIPPASPLFPRVSSGALSSSASGPPNLPYIMSPQLTTAYNISSQSSDDGTGAAWGGNDRNQTSYPSPQIAYGIPGGRNASGGRAYSFDGAESLLPPAALDDPAYSPYSNSMQNSPTTQALFHHHQQQQQSWGYAAPPPDPYSQAPASPLQPRPAGVAMYPGMPPPHQGGGAGGGMMGLHHHRGGGGPLPPGAPMVGPYGQYFPASSPGPPIQTTASNKGPDGANLFIFHIPNHFTNLDMYQLFTPYGNLLSVRIMVEKNTGRSRGFGFVSYDAPESAALAIKELNGFPIGNKRLKVQHKQIRRQDMLDRGDPQDEYNMDPNYQTDFPSALPPSGASANQDLWFESGGPDGGGGGGGVEAEHPGEAAAAGGGPPDGGGAGEPVTPGAGSGTTAAMNENSKSNAAAAEQASPLANFDGLHGALPDIAGNGPSTTTTTTTTAE